VEAVPSFAFTVAFRCFLEDRYLAWPFTQLLKQALMWLNLHHLHNFLASTLISAEKVGG